VIADRRRMKALDAVHSIREHVQQQAEIALANALATHAKITTSHQVVLEQILQTLTTS
jgi:adenylate kinase